MQSGLRWLAMFLKVIYPDGKTGTASFSSLTSLIKIGKIVAFECSQGWVETRRKRNSDYKGPERRKYCREFKK